MILYWFSGTNWRDFETLGISDEIEVATIAFDEETILDFRVSVIMMVAQACK